MFDFSSWHKGHKKTYANHGGKVVVICEDCQVAGELEAISGKISPADSAKELAADRILAGQMSPGIDWKGKKE